MGSVNWTNFFFREFLSLGLYSLILKIVTRLASASADVNMMPWARFSKQSKTIGPGVHLRISNDDFGMVILSIIAKISVSCDSEAYCSTREIALNLVQF